MQGLDGLGPPGAYSHHNHRHRTSTTTSWHRGGTRIPLARFGWTTGSAGAGHRRGTTASTRARLPTFTAGRRDCLVARAHALYLRRLHPPAFSTTTLPLPTCSPYPPLATCCKDGRIMGICRAASSRRMAKQVFRGPAWLFLGASSITYHSPMPLPACPTPLLHCLPAVILPTHRDALCCCSPHPHRYPLPSPHHTLPPVHLLWTTYGHGECLPFLLNTTLIDR